MTTTNLTVSLSPFNEIVQHGNFDLRSSLPTTGEAWEGSGYWEVERSASVIHTASNILDFNWLGQNGDIVRGRFTDVAADPGSFVSHTFVVTSGTADYDVYVDNAGNNAGTGLIGDPVQTVDEAVNRVLSVMATGHECIIWLKSGQTFSYSGTTPMFPGSNISARVQFRVYSGTAKAIVHVTSDTIFAQAGFRSAIVIDGVDLTGPGSSSTKYAVDGTRKGFGVRPGWDVIVRNCNITNFKSGINIADYPNTELAGGQNDFVGIEDVSFDDISGVVISPATTRRFVYVENAFIMGVRIASRGRTWGVDSGGSNSAPASHVHSTADITSGIMNPARLGSGTANSTTFLRGDNTWSVPSGGSGSGNTYFPSGW